MTRSLIKVLTTALLLIVSYSALAELVVIYDSGNTRSINEFLGPLQYRERKGEPRPVADAVLDVGNAASLLPIESPGLTPGLVSTRVFDLPFASAIFLIGADIQSQQWLMRHREQLMEVQAIGLLIQARSVDELKVIEAIADGLPMTLASGTDIAKVLGVSHYPVAVSGGQIWQ